MSKRQVPAFRDEGGLLVYRERGRDQCLGFLMDLPGHGIFDAHCGKVDVTPEAAKTHNQILDQAMVKGLDENCQVGQGGTFYFRRAQDRPAAVQTFMGTLVSSMVDVAGQVITFYRGGKTYRGKLRKDSDCFSFRRVA